MKLLLPLLLLFSAGLAVSQEVKKDQTKEDSAASRLIKKKREKIRTTETVKRPAKESDSKDNE